jgi:hypothetical protein
MHTRSRAGGDRQRAVATALVALITMLPTSAASASKEPKPPAHPPKTETLNLALGADGDYSSTATANLSGCQTHETENDHLKFNVWYTGLKVKVDGQTTQVTKSASEEFATGSDWETTQDGHGDDCAADVTCTSNDVDSSTAGDPDPQAYVVGEGVMALQLRVESVGHDFIANNTQGNQACPTQVTGEGSLLFVALLNDGLVKLIPLYFTAAVDVPLDYLQALKVGETQDDHVSIKHVPVAHCEHGVWTSCTDSLDWQGTLSITRTA